MNASFEDMIARLLKLLLGLLLPATLSLQVAAADLRSAWHFVQADGVCLLEQQLVGYGEARFVGVPGHGLRFELLPRRDLFHPEEPVLAEAVAPDWHPSYPERARRGPLEHIRGGAVSAHDPVATALLMDLVGGRKISLTQPTWFAGDPVDVQVLPLRLRAAHDAFSGCYQWLMPANFEDVARSRLLFAANATKLSAAHRERLAEVVHYVNADPSITRIFVDGHTDPSGNERENMRISEQRARAVAAELKALGIDPERIVVRYHAARYPVAQGTDRAAREQNRRATVRLERAEADHVAGV